MQTVSSTSQLLSDLAENHKRERISLGEITAALHERGFGILFIVFCLPLLIPLPIPTGLGTAMSMPIFFFAYQLTINRDSPWLPEWVLKKELGIDTFRKIVAKSVPILKFIEKFLKERLLSVSASRRYEIFTGIFILLLNIPICLPFPMSNTIPAISIIVIAFGMIERDGIMLILGKIIGIIAWIVCIMIGFAIFYGANEVTKYLPDGFKSKFKFFEHRYLYNAYDEPSYFDNDSDYENISADDKEADTAK